MIQLSGVVCNKIQRRLTCYSSIIKRSHNILLDWDFIPWLPGAKSAFVRSIAHGPWVPAGQLWKGSSGQTGGQGVKGTLLVPGFQVLSQSPRSDSPPLCLVPLSDSGWGRQLTYVITNAANDLKKQVLLSPIYKQGNKVWEEVSNVPNIREVGLTLKTTLSLPVERPCWLPPRGSLVAAITAGRYWHRVGGDQNRFMFCNTLDAPHPRKNWPAPQATALQEQQSFKNTTPWRSWSLKTETAWRCLTNQCRQ